MSRNKKLTNKEIEHHLNNLYSAITKESNRNMKRGNVVNRTHDKIKLNDRRPKGMQITMRY